MSDLPTDIQHSQQIYSLNEKLKNLRAEFDYAVGKIQSGTFSIKKTFNDIVERTDLIINEIIKTVEILIIPQDKFADFKSGDVTLDQYGSFDLLNYYNGLRRLKLIYSGINVALLQIGDVNKQPLSSIGIGSKPGIIDSLDDREFIEQGFANPTTEIEIGYDYYTINDGDTLQSIAAKYGDYSFWPQIAKTNNISDSDLIDDNLSGTVIKIPISSSKSQSGNLANMVFEPIFNGTDQKLLDRYRYGRDIYLNNGKMEADGSGDLRVVEGVECVMQNIQDRFNSPKGSLNPMTPDWGISVVRDYRSVPPVIAIDKVIKDMESQGLADPRVESAMFNYSKMKINGDAFYSDMEFRLLGNSPKRLTVKVR